MHDAPLTAASTIDRWLDSPTGGPLLRELLAGSGQTPQALAPVAHLPLGQLVALSAGRMPQGAVDDLVRAANDGVLVQEETPAAAPGSARFAGRTVIVTGAASGIGRATAVRVAREGGRVIAVDLAAEGLDALAAEHGEQSGPIVPVAGDLTRSEDRDRVLEAADGRIDALANIAGIMDGMVPLHETEDALWDRVLGVNLDAVFRLTRAVIPLMRAAGAGAIVNVASEASLRGNAAGTAYTVSKHAVVGLTRSAAFLYGPDGIRVNAVAPGPTATGIEGSMRSEMGAQRLGPFLRMIPPVATAETMAASITWLLSDDSANVSGVILPSDGGWSVQ
ncbi:SDR family NAD(P)-dependent oxidoreductase [Brachybacterium phenoliresistens]|uniref:Short-chain dehydrogenase n=1 Tax=Brachybacterium phenoliresistens TaxID=396014 RepID=Z9JXA9_9MICO|nr:SDR family NAD(P)-dependent oxidoreductase [Brachybacterium phenoliresistens]EWS82623.1 short-chain dehydrogenase [Brachybacterium phenoliresistens]